MIRKISCESGIVADLFCDDSTKPHKPIVLLGGSEGGKTWSSIGTKPIVRQLVSQGYTLLSLAYFKHPELPPTLEEIPLEYFENAFHCLLNQSEVHGQELAIIGVSRGAEAALLLGSMNPKIRLVISLSGSHVIWQGIPKLGSSLVGRVRSDWTYQGTGLPCVRYGDVTWNYSTLVKTMLSGELCKIHQRALQDTTQVEAARIPVEKIQGAILLMSGKKDKMWPSTMMSEQIVSRLSSTGFVYPFKHIAFDAGHTDYLRNKDCQQAMYAFLKENYPPS